MKSSKQWKTHSYGDPAKHKVESVRHKNEHKGQTTEKARQTEVHNIKIRQRSHLFSVQSNIKTKAKKMIACKAPRMKRKQNTK